jgi:hypothetical protein
MMSRAQIRILSETEPGDFAQRRNDIGGNDAVEDTCP